jgi:hypothetical protein
MGISLVFINTSEIKPSMMIANHKNGIKEKSFLGGI